MIPEVGRNKNTSCRAAERDQSLRWRSTMSSGRSRLGRGRGTQLAWRVDYLPNPSLILGDAFLLARPNSIYGVWTFGYPRHPLFRLTCFLSPSASAPRTSPATARPPGMSRPYIPPEQQFAAWSGVAFPKAPLPIDAQPPLSPSSASVRKESLPLSSRASSPRSSPPPPNLQRTWISEPPQPSYVGWERRAGSPPAKGAVSNRRSAPPNRRRYGWDEPGGMKDDIRDFDPNHPSSRPLSVGLQRQSSYSGRSTNRHHSAPLARSASQGPPVRPQRPPSPTPLDLTLMPTYPFKSKYHVQKAKPLFSRASHDSAMSDVSAPFDLDLPPKSTPYSSFTVSNFNPHPTGSPKLEDFEFSQVAVASRVRRDDGSRGLGVATIIPVSRVSSPILFHPPSPIHSEPPSPVLEVRQASPSPPGSPNHSRPASYASSSSPLTLIRRNSSVYDPNPPISLPLVVSPPPAQPRVIADVDTLASRTSHVSMTPGYYGRIELLEKLEALLGCPLSVYESEEIIAIGGSNMMGTVSRLDFFLVSAGWTNGLLLPSHCQRGGHDYLLSALRQTRRRSPAP